MNITKALVIADPWISKIFAGEKTWEMRSKNISRRGSIALIKKGSGTIVGVVSITGVSGPYTDEGMADNFSKHQVPDGLVKTPDYNWRYAWHLDHAIAFNKPVPYRHPSGAVTWVNLSSETQKALNEQLQAQGCVGDELAVGDDSLDANTSEILANTVAPAMHAKAAVTGGKEATLDYVPIARDGSIFHKELKNASGFYTVGDRKAEKKFESYEEALAYLKSVPVARWRRPNAKGVAGIVSAVDWVSSSSVGGLRG